MCFYKCKKFKSFIFLFVLFSLKAFLFSELVNLDERDFFLNVEDVKKNENFLGRGALKEVYKINWDGRDSAIVFFNLNDNGLKTFLKELTFYSNYENENIMKAFAYSKKNRFLIIKYAPMDLFNYFDKFFSLGRSGNEGFYFSKDKVKYFLDICNGLRYLQANRIIHRDIKLENIVLIRKPKRGFILKLIDFDNYVVLPEGQDFVLLEDNFGTLGYKAPELIFSRRVDDKRLFPYSFASDIYSVGVLFFNILTERSFFVLVLDTLQLVIKKKINKKKFKNNIKYKTFVYKHILKNYTEILVQIFNKYLSVPEDVLRLSKSEKDKIFAKKKLFTMIFRMLASQPEIRPNVDQVIDGLEDFNGVYFK
jgi:serine/threonine protein kinase